MALHVFANFVTPYGTAANNRGETEGNITTLQKLIWKGRVHSSVSAEALRFALRARLEGEEEKGTNRSWDEAARANTWRDTTFKGWSKESGETFIDDDLLGFMTAEASAEAGKAGSANVRRAVLEVTRAVSLTPWPGDVTFNAASVGATASAQKKGANPVPYGTEVHATRYQFGIAFTPERLRDPTRAAKALRALASLRKVAGNHSRFLFDFSPDAVVLRVTDDPAPRVLYCFETTDDGGSVVAPGLLERVESGDVAASELVLGGSFVSTDTARALEKLGATVEKGVKAAVEAATLRIDRELGIA